MNPLALLGGVATGGWSVYLKLAWKLLPWVIGAGMFVALMITRGTLHNARQDAKQLASDTATAIAESKAAWALQGKDAAETYAKAIADRQPIILRSTNEVTKYAQTPAGRALCSDPLRVQGIDALDRSLFAPATESGAGTVPANTSPSTGGRIGK